MITSRCYCEADWSINAGIESELSAQRLCLVSLGKPKLALSQCLFSSKPRAVGMDYPMWDDPG